MNTIILHGNILTAGGVLEDRAVQMRDGEIVAICSVEELSISNDAEVTDASGLFVAPGLIDAHTHGGMGFDFMTCSVQELDTVLAWLPSTGVTSVLPTLASSPLGLELEMVKRLAEAQRRPSPGAIIAGLHLEGPYINPEMRGAQPADSIRLPVVQEMQYLVKASNHSIRLITLAPELPGAMDLIQYLVEQGITVSAGHTNATYEEMLVASRAGLNRVAHLYNGMAAFQHRNPGVVGAALELENVYAEVILDGIHIHPAAARLALRVKGLSRLVLVTDATQAAGLGDGVYVRPGNRKITVKDGAARLDSGALAGSILSMDRAVANAQMYLGLPLHQAVLLASQNAAESLNLPAKGRLEPGYDADVIIMDAEMNIHSTFVGGHKVYSRYA